MTDPLLTYLQDHLAGAGFALNLLDGLRTQHAGDELGGFAASLGLEIEEDRRMLQSIAERAGGGPSVIKDAAGWITEKASRLKLRHQAGERLGTFEALETLALGILGKRSLWDALAVRAVADPRLAGIDFAGLAARAIDQHARVEAQRLALAATALAPA